ncbi:TRAP transporter small permease [Brucella sp. C7-11G]
MSNFTKDRLVAFAAGGLLSILFIVIFTQVVLRAIGYPLAWVEEFSAVAFIWLVFAGAAGAFLRHEHLEVDLLYNAMTPRCSKAILRYWGVLILSLSLVFLGVLAVGLVLVTRQTWPNFMGTMPGFRFGVIYLGVLVSVAISLLVVWSQLVLLLKQK